MALRGRADRDSGRLASSYGYRVRCLQYEATANLRRLHRGVWGLAVVEENELLTLLVALAVVVFVVVNRSGLTALPRSNLSMTAFYLLAAGLTFTVLEGLVWRGGFNVLEHACYAASSILLAVWVWLILREEMRCSKL